MKIKKGDNVIMLSGKDRNKTGKIVKVDQKEDKLIVEGLNMVKKAIRARNQNQKGQVVSKERYVSVSSVAIVCKACGKPTRIGYKVNGESKTRICKKCQAEL
jgi:large subunit ribosomal protein L24